MVLEIIHKEIIIDNSKPLNSKNNKTVVRIPTIEIFFILFYTLHAMVDCIKYLLDIKNLNKFY